MHRLFWGLFFVLLDIDLTVGRATFEILPDFVGFFLLIKGMEEQAGTSPSFEKSRHVAFGLFLLSAVYYGAGLLNLEPMTKVVFWVLEFICLAVFLWLLRGIAADGSEQLKGLWLIVAVVEVLSALLSWVPLIGSICRAAALVTGIVFLLAYWKEIRRSAE